MEEDVLMMDDTETIVPSGAGGFDDEDSGGVVPVYRDLHAGTKLEPVSMEEASAAGLAHPFPMVERLRDNFVRVSATEPSKAYEGLCPSIWYATVVRRPFLEKQTSSPRLTRRKHPVPYVHLPMPGLKQAWPNSADC